MNTLQRLNLSLAKEFTINGENAFSKSPQGTEKQRDVNLLISCDQQQEEKKQQPRLYLRLCSGVQ